MLREGLLFGVENPLLDIIATVDTEFLKKYQLDPNGTIVATDEERCDLVKRILDDVTTNYSCSYLAGGSELNSLRVLQVGQWILKQPNVSTFLGSIGDDENGQTLLAHVASDGVNVKSQIQQDIPTGFSVVLITGNERSLCTDLCASKYFTVEYLNKNFSYVNRAKFYYVTGYFLPVSFQSVKIVAKYACPRNRPFIFNLSAPIIPKLYKTELMKIMPYVDVIFGNSEEARTFGEVNEFGTSDVTEIALQIAALPKLNKRRDRWVIITQGPNPIITVSGVDKTVQSFPIPAIPTDKIKDSNGCGDAFVGGFLAQYIQGNILTRCIECGQWAAGKVLQESGCQFPKDEKYVDVSDKDTGGNCCLGCKCS